MINYLSKVKLGNTIYLVKDEEARATVTTLQTAVASSLVFKGVISSATDIISLTEYKIGWTYKASADFTIPELGKVENGDMIICIANYSGGYKAADWTIVQNNIDVMGGSTASNSGMKGLVPAPSVGDQKHFLRGDGTWQPCAIPWGSFSDLIPKTTTESWGAFNESGNIMFNDSTSTQEDGKDWGSFNENGDIDFGGNIEEDAENFGTFDENGNIIF